MISAQVEGHPFHSAVGKWLTLGIHHSGVQIGNKEFSFTLEGIVITDPRPPMHRCRLTSSHVQATQIPGDLVLRALGRLQSEYTPQTYDPITRNCNHFSAAFVAALTGRQVPGWINRAPTVAGLFGTRFQLKRATATAPPLACSVLLPTLRSRLYERADELPDTPALLVVTTTGSSPSNNKKKNNNTVMFSQSSTDLHRASRIVLLENALPSPATTTSSGSSSSTPHVVTLELS